jgi:hypothetical protein
MSLKLDNCTSLQKYELEKIQYEAARIATGATKLVSIRQLENETGWESLECRRRKHKLILFYKMVNNQTPSYLSSLVPPLVGDESRYYLRNTEDVQSLNARTKLYSDSFLPSVIREWNSLPIQVRNSTSVATFKQSLSRTSNNIPSYYYVGDRKAQVIHTRLRTNCSSLNLCLFQKGIVDNPQCHCGDIESAQHFFFNCQTYQHLRLNLLNEVNPILPSTVKLFLNGDPSLDIASNTRIFEAVHTYIMESKRFV